MKQAVLNQLPSVAYFSMEVGIDPNLPTYSGGLGVLAGDTLLTAAELGIPMVGVTLLYHKGYFRQHLDAQGNQSESPYSWDPERHLELLTPQVSIMLEDRPIKIQAWRYEIPSEASQPIPIYFLDTWLEENDPAAQALTDSLYMGDDRVRLGQEAVLGLGGIAMLRALRHTNLRIYHMNEGHSALLILGLVEELTQEHGLKSVTEAHYESVREHCVFTTHTPVPAGHDQFPGELVTRLLGEDRAKALEAVGCCPARQLNMTRLALHFARYINGVAMRHSDISQDMFPHYPIESITNGVHAASWVSLSFAELFDHYIPNWRSDNLYLRHAIRIPLAEIREAHELDKHVLLTEVCKRSGISLNPKTFTLGFARRATTYKRPHLLFSNLEQFKRIAKQAGPIQVLFGGKAHPQDEPGKQLIREIFQAAQQLTPEIPVVYLEEYDMALAKLMCAGVDVWLNTPQKPQEASGTSGMKAALNGVPSLSILDGWWVEGHLEGVTGWAIGSHWEDNGHHEHEVESLYHQLEHVILPLYYQQAEQFDWIRRRTIALNGCFFNSQRMMLQYLKHAYLDF